MSFDFVSALNPDSNRIKSELNSYLTSRRKQFVLKLDLILQNACGIL